MREKSLYVCIVLVLVVVLMSACVPQSYTTPIAIHITAGDYIHDAKIAIDAGGLKHITGVVDDRVVYYRTRFGQPIRQIPLTMPGCTIEGCIQSNPDIAVTDTGEAFITWVEQYGGPEKFACWRSFTPAPPIGGYKTYCAALDSTNQTTGNVQVVGNGTAVYAIFDRKYASDPEIGTIFYRELTGGTAYVAYDYAFYMEAGYIYSMVSLVDASDKLHIALIDEDGIGDIVPRLKYLSNAHTNVDGSMDQMWIAPEDPDLDEDVLSISLYMSGVTERVSFAYVLEPTPGIDDIYIRSCETDGCITHDTSAVNLPASFGSKSYIDDVELAQADGELYASFIGIDVTPALVKQIWWTGAGAFSPDDSIKLTNTPTIKFDLEMESYDASPNTYGIGEMTAMSWVETNLSTIQFRFYDGLLFGTTLDDFSIGSSPCNLTVPEGNLATNGLYLAGVWDACETTRFTSRAYLNDLPLIKK
jgi:hypothetical protein